MYTTRNIYPAKVLNSAFEELLNAFPNAQKEPSVSKIPVNIYEDENGFHLELQVPGRSKEEISIKLEQNLLTISAEAKKGEEKNYKTIRREFATNSFSRSFNVDNKINVDGIKAKYDQGVLVVFLPKKEEIKNSPKQIVVS